MLFFYFPTHRGNKKSLLLFLFLADYILSVWLIVCMFCKHECYKLLANT